MKIDISFHFDCFPNKCTNSEVKTCRTNVLQRARDRKGGGGRKEVNLSILAMDTNRKYHGTDNNNHHHHNKCQLSSTKDESSCEYSCAWN